MEHAVAHEITSAPLDVAVAPALDTRAVVLAGVIGLPLALAALATGIGSEVPAWSAPWALAGAAGFLLGRRTGLVLAGALAAVALVLGPACLLGVAGGAAAGLVATRGSRPLLALAAGSAAMLVLAGTIALAAPGV